MTRLVLFELFVTNVLLFEHNNKKLLVSWQFSGTYGVTKYGSGWRKDVVNQRLEFVSLYDDRRPRCKRTARARSGTCLSPSRPLAPVVIACIRSCLHVYLSFDDLGIISRSKLCRKPKVACSVLKKKKILTSSNPISVRILFMST